MKKILFTFLILAAGLSSFSQETALANTLLWRISGKGLQKSSYLFGTMHLTDKRVFQLGDSVYKALEQTEGFAAELDMNRIGTQMINRMMKEKEEKAAREPLKVKEAVDKKTWNLYKEQLGKKFNMNADNISVDDLDDVESKLQADLFKKGDMPTFLDAWLFGQARKQGKWVGGIEDLEDQFEVIDKDDIEDKIQLALFDDQYYRGGLEWFIKTYSNQKLDTIDTYMYREENGKKDYIMIKRNLKMARRMDSLSAIRSTLFAVGAAHLPGDSGLITLLRSRGFTVTPVISSKKIDANKYISKVVESPWIPVDIKDSSYSLQMPGVGDMINMYESMGLEIKTFFDIAFMKMYMTVGIELPEARRKLGTDSLYKALKNRYTREGGTIKDKQVTINGVTGREFRMSNDDGEMRMQVFIPGMERIILNAVFAFSEKTLNESETEKFFQSFAYNNKPLKPSTEEKTWTRMDYPLLAFSMEMPMKPKETKDVVSEEGKIIYSWQAVDLKEQVFYGIRVSAMKEGMYDAGDDTAYFLGIKERMKENFKDSKVLDSSFITMSKYPGYRFYINGKAEGEFLQTGIMAISRGGFGYYLYAVYDPAGAGKVSGERFLHSFKLLPYDHPEWKSMISPGGSFSSVSPVPIKEKETSEEDDIHPGANRFIVYDSLAAVTMYVDESILPRWLWYGSDTGFLHQRAKEYSSWNDSIAGYTVSTSGNGKTASFEVIKPGEHVVKKVMLVLNGDELYEVFGHLAAVDLPGMYDRFFDGFKTLHKKKNEDRSASKLNELAAIMSSADKKTAEEIKRWWDYLEFSNADLPALQKMLFKIYPDFDSAYYGNLNRSILDKVKELDSTHTTVGFIKNNYSSIQPKDEYVKPILISYLSGIETTESYAVLKDCLVKYPVNIGKPQYIPHSLYDSLELTATLYPEVLKLTGNESMWRLISGTTVSLLDSNLLDKKIVKEYGNYITGTAKMALDNDKDDIEENSYFYTDLIRLLGIINTSEANSLLNRFSKFNNKEIRFSTLIAMLENDQPVDNKTLYTLAITDEYRHNLYDELKRINKLKLFPANFLSQKELGKSKLYEYANEDEDYMVNTLEYAGEKTVSYKGKQQKFYLYKISFSDDGGSYLGVAGPYSSNPKDYSSTHDATGLYWDEEFDPKKTESLLKDYLAMLEKQEEDMKEEEIPTP